MVTVTKDQAQMLATLAAACRPNGARRWDTAGIVAAIARVKDRSLSEVVMAVIRAAADRDVDSPGVIPTPGTHWQESQAVRPYKPQTIDKDNTCSVCSQSRERCQQLWAGDHEYVATTQVRAAKPTETFTEARKSMPRRTVIAKPDKFERPPRCGEACIRAEGHTGDHLPPVRQAAAVAAGGEEEAG